MSKPIPDASVLWVLTSLRGRLSAQSYRLGAALMIVVQVYVLINVVGVDKNNQNELALWGLIMIASWLASTWVLVAMSVKRLHDVEYSPYFAVALFLPPLALIFVLVLMNMQGSQNTNEHGPPPFPEKN